MSIGALSIKITGDISDFNKNIASVQKQLNASTKGLQVVARSMTTVGDSLTKTVTVPLLAVGAVLFKLGTDFDSAYDKIRIGTGKTGKEFEGLQTDFKAVAKVAASSFDDIGTAITGYNQKLGLTGKPLQELSTQILNVSRLTKTDLNTNIDNSAKLFNNWKIATADQSKTLDLMFKASQQTGIGIDKLMGSVADSGAVLRGMGYNLETSIALIAQFDKEGIDFGTTVAGMKKALVTMAKEGFTDPQEVLAIYIERIKGAKTDIEAIGIAAELFGKSGGAMAMAIREGRFELDDLIVSLKNSKESIAKAVAATDDWKEKLILLQHAAGIALEPFANKVFDSAGRAIEGVIPKVEGLATVFGELSPKMQDNILLWTAIIMTVPPAISIFGRGLNTIRAFRNEMLLLNAVIKASSYGGIGVSLFGAVGAGGLASAIAVIGGLVNRLGNLTKAFATGELAAMSWNDKILEIVNVSLLGIPEILNAITRAAGLPAKEFELGYGAMIKAIFEGKPVVEAATISIEDQTKAYNDALVGVTALKTRQHEGIETTVEQKMAFADNELAIQSLMAQYPELTRAEAEAQVVIDETTKSTDDQAKSIDDLRNEFNKLIDDIFGGITTYNDFEEAGWAVEAAQKAVAEAEKELEKAQKATGSRFTANDTALQAYLSTNSEYLELSAKGSEIQDKLNKMQEEGDTTSSAYYAKQQQLVDVQGKLNEVITEATKKTGDYTSTGKQTEKQIAATAEATRNLEQKYNDLDDAMIANIETAFKLSTEIGATTAQQEEARKKAVELGLEYVATGAISEQAFIDMAAKFGMTSADIIKYADDMGIEIDNAARLRIIKLDISDVIDKVKVAQAALDSIHSTSASITTTYFTNYAGGRGMAAGGPVGFSEGGFLDKILSASAGINLPKFDNGGVLAMLHPPEIVLNKGQALNVLWNLAQRPIDTKQTTQSSKQEILLKNVINLDGKVLWESNEKYAIRATGERV